MKPRTSKKLILQIAIVAIFLIIGCKEKEIDGVLIGDTLLVHQELKENRELADAIKKVLNKDESGIYQIMSIDCGGGAGCYDLGFVVTQLIYKIGEEEFVNMINKADKEKIKGIGGLIRAGLEYGDNDKDGVMDNKRINEKFPMIDKKLNE
jgi:hypothetical protein